MTDKDGKFQLSTAAINDGAVAGDHKITVVVAENTKGAVDTSAMMDPSKMAESYNKTAQAAEFGKGKATNLPAKYASMTTTPLKETVKAEGTNNFILELA